MSQILLLTKNILNEGSFEKKIHQLGHEVFTSSVLIPECLQENGHSEFINMFHHVILSETIDSTEVKLLAKNLKNFSVVVHRKSDEHLSEAELLEWKEQGIKDWIECSPTIEVLREKLSQEKVMREGKLVLLTKIKEKRPISSLMLSGGELKLFIILFQQRESLLSRDELCIRMWNKRKNNSAMSQLSVMVKNLRSKLASQDLEGPIIETFWGKGYRLHESVYNQVYLDTKELKYAND